MRVCLVETTMITDHVGLGTVNSSCLGARSRPKQVDNPTNQIWDFSRRDYNILCNVVRVCWRAWMVVRFV